MQFKCAVCGAAVNRSSRRAVGGEARVAEHFTRGARCAGSDIPVEARIRQRGENAEDSPPRAQNPILLLNTGGRRPAKSVFSRRVLGALRSGKSREVDRIGERREP